jgi:hypothetical protein
VHEFCPHTKKITFVVAMWNLTLVALHLTRRYHLLEAEWKCVDVDRC